MTTAFLNVYFHECVWHVIMPSGLVTILENRVFPYLQSTPPRA